jgi:hypothetical protein
MLWAILRRSCKPGCKAMYNSVPLGWLYRDWRIHEAGLEMPLTKYMTLQCMLHFLLASYHSAHSALLDLPSKNFLYIR